MRKLILIAIVSLLNLYPATYASERIMPNTNLNINLTEEYGKIIKEIKKESYYEVDVYVTAYSAGDDYTPGVIMASGKKVYEGSVAYNNVPLGTILEIDGNKYIVEDRVLNDNVVDIYMDSKERALKFGRHIKTVKIRRN